MAVRMPTGLYLVSRLTVTGAVPAQTLYVRYNDMFTVYWATSLSSPPSVRVIGDSVSYLPDGLNRIWQNNYSWQAGKDMQPSSYCPGICWRFIQNHTKLQFLEPFSVNRADTVTDNHQRAHSSFPLSLHRTMIPDVKPQEIHIWCHLPQPEALCSHLSAVDG